MNEGNVLRVYMKEDDRYQNEPLYEALMLHLRKQNVLWVDIQRALEGFGEDHVIRKEKLFSFSEHAPIVLEALLEDSESRDSILDSIQPLLLSASGPAILLPVQMVK